MGMNVNFGTGVNSYTQKLPSSATNSYSSTAANPFAQPAACDSVSFSGKYNTEETEKKGMSTGAKVGLVAAAATVIVGAIAASRGKKLNTANGETAKLWNNIKTGVKSIFTKAGRAQYRELQAINSKNAHKAASELQDKVDDIIKKETEKMPAAADAGKKVSSGAEKAAKKTDDAIVAAAGKTDDAVQKTSTQELESTLKGYQEKKQAAQSKVDDLLGQQKTLDKRINGRNEQEARLKKEIENIKNGTTKIEGGKKATNKAIAQKQKELDTCIEAKKALEADKTKLAKQITNAQNSAAKLNSNLDVAIQSTESKIAAAKQAEFLAADADYITLQQKLQRATSVQEKAIQSGSNAVDRAKGNVQELERITNNYKVTAEQYYTAQLNRENVTNQITELNKQLKNATGKNAASIKQQIADLTAKRKSLGAEINGLNIGLARIFETANKYKV